MHTRRRQRRQNRLRPGPQSEGTQKFWTTQHMNPAKPHTHHRSQVFYPHTRDVSELNLSLALKHAWAGVKGQARGRGARQSWEAVIAKNLKVPGVWK